MIGTLGLAGAIIAGSVILFVVSIRVGILLGRRLDRAIEERTARDPEPASPVVSGESMTPGSFGHEENRGD